MPRRGLMAGAWALVTIAATLLAWAAVRQVTDEVSPSGVRPLPTIALGGPADDPPDEGAEPAPADVTGPGPLRSPTEEPTAGGPFGTEPSPTAPTPEPRSTPDARADEATPAPEPARDAPVTQAYDLRGGVVTVRYRDATATLVTATPASGFRVDVHDGGPTKVDVRFRSDDHESRLVARWRGGAPDPQIDERPR